MKSFHARLAALAAAALSAGVLVSAGPADAATGNINYSCAITKDYKFTFTFDQDTNLPAKIWVGKSYNSTYTATTILPSNGVGLARFFGVSSFDGAIDATVLVNGVARVVHAPIPKTNVPASGDLVLKAKGPLGALGKASAGKIVLKPSTIKFTVNAYKSDNSKLFGVDKANCAMSPNTKVMDSLFAIKSPSTTTATAVYAKAAKKVTATASVTSLSGVAPTGKVTATLYRGSTKVKSVSVALVGGKATTAFTGVKAKGSYKVVTTYGGSAALNGSSTTKTFKVS